jgi:para-nitrobenzyl esterase
VNTPAQHTIDGYVFTDESVDLLRPGVLNGIDIMIGGTSDEYTSLMGEPDKPLSDAEFADAMSKIGYDDTWKKVYRPSDPQDAIASSLRAKADYNLQGYLLSAEIAKRRNKDFNVYTFYFNHAPPGRNTEFYGSFHSSDLGILWTRSARSRANGFWTGADYRMADTMSSYLANFVKTGNPNARVFQIGHRRRMAHFMRFHDGYALSVKHTPYPERDELNRQAIIRVQKLENETGGER